MTKLRMNFVEAIDNGDLNLAQDILLQMGDIYTARGGYDTVEEKVEFERVVRWFDKEVAEAGLLREVVPA